MNRRIISLISAILFTILLPTNGFAASDNLNLQSETAVLMESDSGDILYGENSDKRMYPASITKIITGIIAIEEGNLDDTVTISENAAQADGTSVYLIEGEQVPLKKLVQGLMINSGNDAAVAIAEHMDGSVAAFSHRMNAFVKEKVGVYDSNFKNPHGLPDDDHYTTAADMAEITRYAMNNPIFREIVGTKELPWVGESWDTTLINHNKILWRYEGATGVKNGWTTKSGHTLVSSAERNGMELIAVVMKVQGFERAYRETTTLFDYGYDNFEKGKVAKDTKFNHNGKEFKAYEDFYYTKPKDSSVTTDVSPWGQLIVESDGEIRGTTQLALQAAEKIESPAAVEVNSESVDEEEKGFFQNIFGWIGGLF
ncbi:D-alanyl-D-alanine carboxypeptidase family protein [Thalassobacillus hwangdonensis]|uniref:D-alanyl-D-alanine carboxypeptidase family protein n=1 Tax=Thalassobacillus hwangdonensis TaxID=546108 RepID=A0ABW3L1Y2_9BACI